QRLGRAADLAGPNPVEARFPGAVHLAASTGRRPYASARACLHRACTRGRCRSRATTFPAAAAAGGRRSPPPRAGGRAPAPTPPPPPTPPPHRPPPRRPKKITKVPNSSSRPHVPVSDLLPPPGSFRHCLLPLACCPFPVPLLRSHSDPLRPIFVHLFFPDRRLA